MLFRRFLTSIAILGAISLVLTAPAEACNALPPGYDEYLSAKKMEIEALIPSQVDGFVFWADTHFKEDGESISSEIISTVLNGLPRPKAIWGGDAITAYTNDVEQCWKAQKVDFARLDKNICLLPVRGNHDLTARESKDIKAGYSLSPNATFKAFSAVTAKGVVRNPKDKTGLYYYYDEPNARIRYIVADVFDRFEGTDVFWGVKEGVSDQQLKWLTEEAMDKAPGGWSLVFAMHSAIGFEVETHKCYIPLVNAIETLPQRRPDLHVLMVLGGHRHHDMQTVRSAVWYVQIACDAPYADGTRSPFSPAGIQRKKDTPDEHAMDYVSISNNGKTVSMVRIGYGANRTYHLSPIEIKVGENLSMQGNGIVNWVAYDAIGSKYKNKKWQLSCDVAGITPDGQLFGLSEGESVVVAIDSAGNQEYYYVKVK